MEAVAKKEKSRTFPLKSTTSSSYKHDYKPYERLSCYWCKSTSHLVKDCDKMKSASHKM